ncbi:hypothetical protein Baya_5051 [Bagarius yarrelli]|uniref:Uncharacterized protein n=1 Tax=Bagarius yarrelli TaxID=175774 RepID=A0A556TV89_BAGYA|nr:hypothetical protein Baya_5051 [Bagarius yarrelli]
MGPAILSALRQRHREGEEERDGEQGERRRMKVGKRRHRKEEGKKGKRIPEIPEKGKDKSGNRNVGTMTTMRKREKNEEQIFQKMKTSSFKKAFNNVYSVVVWSVYKQTIRFIIRFFRIFKAASSKQ